MADVLANEEITFSRDEIGWIQDALTLGLICLGQLHKVLQAKETSKSMGVDLLSHVDVRSPTGDAAEEVATFATAISVINTVAGSC